MRSFGAGWARTFATARCKCKAVRIPDLPVTKAGEVDYYSAIGPALSCNRLSAVKPTFSNEPTVSNKPTHMSENMLPNQIVKVLHAHQQTRGELAADIKDVRLIDRASIATD